MTTRQALVWRLDALLQELRTAEAKSRKLAKDCFVSEDDRRRFSRIYAEDIDICQRHIAQTLDEYDDFPHRFHHHHEKLAEDFWKNAPGSGYDSSVFIMTKFAMPGDPGADRLQGVIDCTMLSSRDRGYHPRLAQGPTFNDWLWANVEAHLLFWRVSRD